MTRSERFHSVDALRGFDMLWIIGGDFLIHYLFEWSGAPVLGLASRQLTHAEWIGVNAYDLVFPLFMFLSGVSVGIVLQRDSESLKKAEFFLRASRRAAILVLLGVLYNWGWRIELAEIRFASVLGLIGGAYLITVAIMLAADRLRGRLIALVGILIFVTVLQLMVPTPDIGSGVLTPEGSINGWIDRTFLPGRLHGGTYDPEGLLGVVSGASITLAGGIIGAHLMSRRLNKGHPNLLGLFVIGVFLVALALVIWPVYPPIKKIWTASFDIFSIGMCICLLVIAILLSESRKLLGLRTFFVVIGANSILIYLAARYFVYPIYKWADAFEWTAPFSAGAVFCIIVLEWLVLRFLYKRRLFLRV